jgi:hypothetical protein
LDEGPVVEIVRVALPGLVPVMLTGLVFPKVKTGRSCAPAGLEVIEAINATLPENPPAGVMVIVELLPVVPPGWTVKAVPEIENPGGTVTLSAVVTVVAW